MVLAFLKNLLIIDFVYEASDVDSVLKSLGPVSSLVEDLLFSSWKRRRNVFVVAVDIVVILGLNDTILDLFLDFGRL